MSITVEEIELMDEEAEVDWLWDEAQRQAVGNFAEGDHPCDADGQDDDRYDGGYGPDPDEPSF